MRRIPVFHLILGMLLITSCVQVQAFPAPGATQPQAAAVTPSSTAMSDAPVPAVPAGWTTHTSQQCEYAISYPAEMETTGQTPYSRTFLFKQDDPDAAARNFLYVSVITPEIREMVKQGVYDYSVYNYDPAATDILLNMQVGESRSVHQSADMASGFTYQRLPDATIGGQAALAYENVQPWEFPAGTKEIRYYLSGNGCTYLIGGYMDTTGSSQPGTITEELFHKVIDTVQWMP